MKAMQNLQQFKGVSKLKKAAMNMLVKMADAKQIESLRETFDQIDTDHSGMISAEELRNAIKGSKLEIPVSQVDNIID